MSYKKVSPGSKFMVAKKEGNIIAAPFFPDSLVVGRETQWKESGEAMTRPSLQFDKGGLKTVSVTLFLNSYGVGALAPGAFKAAQIIDEIDAVMGIQSGSGKDDAKPPILTIGWGKDGDTTGGITGMDSCVLVSYSATITMVDPDSGQAVRATLDLEFKEYYIQPPLK